MRALFKRNAIEFILIAVSFIVMMYAMFYGIGVHSERMMDIYSPILSSDALRERVNYEVMVYILAFVILPMGLIITLCLLRMERERVDRLL